MIRTILSLMLMLVTTLLVSCGGPSATTPPPTYTADKIEQLQTFLAPVETARNRMSELAGYIKSENWINAENFIHGPLGELRHDISYLSRNLLPSDQKTARNLSKEIFFHIEKIDAAAKEGDYYLAANQYDEALKDFDDLLNLIPKPNASA